MTIHLDDLRQSIGQLGLALRRPEELAMKWRDRSAGGGPSALIFPVFVANAIVGIAVYGLVMRLPDGVHQMLYGAFSAPLAAGLAWALALPALYIINSALGSRLDLSTTVLAATVTVSFGSLAMLASVPITWFFGLALPYTGVRLCVNLLVFAGVGVAMSDVFLRVMKALEPTRSRAYAYLWLALVAVTGGELFKLLHVFAL